MKNDDVEECAMLLAKRGINYELAFKNLCECDRQFIDKLLKLL